MLSLLDMLLMGDKVQCSVINRVKYNTISHTGQQDDSAILKNGYMDIQMYIHTSICSQLQSQPTLTHIHTYTYTCGNGSVRGLVSRHDVEEGHLSAVCMWV